MSHRRTYLIIALVGLVSGLGGLLGNVASGVLPEAWQPYLWLAWPLFILSLLALVGLGIWQVRLEQEGRPPEPEAPARPAEPAPPPAARRTVPDDGFAYDVFLSYSSADRGWVRGELLQRLEAAGLKVCIDHRDFEPGAPSVAEMERAVRTSRKTLLILTPAYLASAWTEFEALMLQVLDPANRKRRLIPLLREACDLPLRLRYLTYVDLAHPEDWDAAWTQLLTALGAPPLQEAPEPPARENWCLKHPYPMPPNFTGRAGERAMLNRWLEPRPGLDPEHPLLLVRALGGFGKSALAWHWLLHDVDATRWPCVLWWGFYDAPNFDGFLRETLEYLLGSGATHLEGALHLSPRQQADALLRCLHQPGTLLVLDGFERALRAYGRMDAAYLGDEPTAGDAQSPISTIQWTDCVSPIAEHFLRGVASLPNIRGKVLLTSRLRPRVLECHGGALLAGCREEELTQMRPADAVAFFRARGVRGGRAEIEAACLPYGYHPLSLSLLAGLVVADPQQPGDIRATGHLDVSGDLKARQHHVLETAYASLAPERRKLLSTIACFRGPVGYEALRALAQASQTSEVSETSEVLKVLDTALRDLAARGLLHHDRRANRYDLHPIVRRYAYDRLGGKERAGAHGQLRDYFAAVPPPERVERLEDLNPAIELYHHTVRAGQYDEAQALFRDRLEMPTYFQFGAYPLRIELLRALFPDGENRPPRLKDEDDQGWTLTALANSYSLSSQPRRAVPLFEQDIAICDKRGDKRNLAIGLGNLALDQIRTGALRAAEANLRRQIALCREIEDELQEAVGHQELGRLLAYRGAWAGAEEELAASSRYWEQTNDVQGLCLDEAYRALRALLLARWSTVSGDPISNIQSPIPLARRALELADEFSRQKFVLERDYVRAHWLLGAAHRAQGDLETADRHLGKALARCRGINLVDHEADILLDLARLRAAQGHREEALGHAGEARLIAERSDYALQGADVHLFLAEIEIEGGDREQALEHARQARALAACDGPPDYTYRVAYEEAGALLGRLEAQG